MANTAFKEIKKWNDERGLINKGFDLKNEISFIVEELIEASSNMESKKARKWSKWITKIILFVPGVNSIKENMVDAFADIIVFATGAIYKLGYDTDKVMIEVQNELNDRTGTLIDGKFVKDKKINPYKANFNICKIDDAEVRDLKTERVELEKLV